VVNPFERPLMRRNKVSVADAREAVWEIVSGLGSDSRIPSVRELSEKTGASHVTVFSALKVLERNGLLYSIPRRGFFRTSRMEDASRNTIGVLFRFSEFFLEKVPYAGEILRGIRMGAAEADMDLLFMAYRKDIHSPVMQAGEIKDRRFSGLLVMEVEDPLAINWLRELDYPVIFIESDVFGFGLNVVKSDECSAIVDWIALVAARGIKRVVVIGSRRREDRKNVVPGIGADVRLAAISAAIHASGCGAEMVSVYPGDETGVSVVDEILSAGGAAAIVDAAGLLRADAGVFEKHSDNIAGMLVFEGSRHPRGFPTHLIEKPFEALGRIAVFLVNAASGRQQEVERYCKAVLGMPDVRVSDADNCIHVAVPAALKPLAEQV